MNSCAVTRCVHCGTCTAWSEILLQFQSDSGSSLVTNWKKERLSSWNENFFMKKLTTTCGNQGKFWKYRYIMAFWWFRRLFFPTCLKGMTGVVSCISGFTQKLAVSSELLRNWQCLTQQVHHSYGTAPFYLFLVSSLYTWAMRCKCIFIYMPCVNSVKWMNHLTIVHDIDIPF